MATVLQTQTAVDNFFNANWQDIVDAQEAYFALHGEYIQLLPSPTVIPDDGATADFTITLPTHEIWGEDFSFTISTKIPCQLQIHTHGGATNHGFTVIVMFSKDGVIYRKQRNHNFGAETLGWHELIQFTT